MIDPKRFSLVKPTPDTPFHIDFAWWKQHDNNYRVYLHDCLCQEHRELYINLDDESWIDSINPETAEIKRVDGLQHVLITHCARQPGFLTLNTTLVDAVFRTFLANGNKPMSPNDLGVQINRPGETILRTLAGPQIYKGLRPCHYP
jgi:hypothetical protein